MKFRFKDGDVRHVPALSLAIAPGVAFDVTAEQAAGLVMQCGEDGPLEAVDAEAKAAVEAAFAPPREKAKPAAQRARGRTAKPAKKPDEQQQSSGDQAEATSEEKN